MSHWQLFNRDLLDMDATSSVDKEGDRLEAGLRALWSVTLLEKVRGLSDFWLRIDGDHTRDITIEWKRVPGPGADRLKAWAAADDTIHDLLAGCEARLLDTGLPASTIHESLFGLASRSGDADTFRREVDGLAAELGGQAPL